jgi:hypothetical protein
MNQQERLQLDKLIRANDVTDNTNSIRDLKHSKPLSDDIITLIKIKKEYQRLSKSNPVQFDNICVSRCPFLFNNYTDIFNKVKKDEIDLNVLFQLLHILKQIEDGKLDQHTGSYEVGKLLKSIYIDSAIKKADNINKAHDHSHGNGNKDHAKPPVVKKISWSEFKAKNPVPTTTTPCSSSSPSSPPSSSPSLSST